MFGYFVDLLKTGATPPAQGKCVRLIAGDGGEIRVNLGEGYSGVLYSALGDQEPSSSSGSEMPSPSSSSSAPPSPSSSSSAPPPPPSSSSSPPSSSSSAPPPPPSSSSSPPSSSSSAPPPSSYLHTLSWGSDSVTACMAFPPDTNYYSDMADISYGARLYYDEAMTMEASSGYYVTNGNQYWDYTSGAGFGSYAISC